MNKVPGLNSNVFFDPVGLPFSQVSGESNPLNAITSAYFKLDETTGDVIDSVAGNNGTNVGATRGVTGKIGNAYSFDGINDLSNIDAVLPVLATTTQGTWSFWIKPVDATPSNNQNLISFGDTNGEERLQLLINNVTGKLRAVCQKGSTTQWDILADSNPLSDGVWGHLALVQDGISPVLYINGVELPKSFIVSTDKTAWFNDLTSLDNGRIGALNFNNVGDVSFYDGEMDEVPFFGTALNQTQITEIYNSGAGKTYPF